MESPWLGKKANQDRFRVSWINPQMDWHPQSKSHLTTVEFTALKTRENIVKTCIFAMGFCRLEAYGLIFATSQFLSLCLNFFHIIFTTFEYFFTKTRTKVFLT